MTDEARRENAMAEARKGRASLAAADALLALGMYDDAMSRLYYAAFHLAAAALLVLGVDAATHSGLLTLFSKHLVKPGTLGPESARILASLLGLRNQADYNRYFTMDEVGAREERLRTQGLIDALEAFLRRHGCA